MTARAAFHPAPVETIAASDLIVCRPPDAPGFIAAAGRGDRHAARVVTAVNDALHRLDAAAPGAALVCAGCAQPLRSDVAFSFVLLLPADERAPHGLALAVCRRCATSRAEVRRKGVAALRREMPGLRLVEPTHAHGGRA